MIYLAKFKLLFLCISDENFIASRNFARVWHFKSNSILLLSNAALARPFEGRYRGNIVPGSLGAQF